MTIKNVVRITGNKDFVQMAGDWIVGHNIGQTKGSVISDSGVKESTRDKYVGSCIRYIEFKVKEEERR